MVTITIEPWIAVVVILFVLAMALILRWEGRLRSRAQLVMIGAVFDQMQTSLPHMVINALTVPPLDNEGKILHTDQGQQLPSLLDALLVNVDEGTRQAIADGVPLMIESVRAAFPLLGGNAGAGDPQQGLELSGLESAVSTYLNAKGDKASPTELAVAEALKSGMVKEWLTSPAQGQAAMGHVGTPNNVTDVVVL